jgi:hypothetical protein
MSKEEFMINIAPYVGGSDDNITFAGLASIAHAKG